MAWTKKEEDQLVRNSSMSALDRLERAWDRHGVHVVGDIARNGQYITIDITPTAAHAMADWLNKVADEQRPGDGS